ncbi:MAG: glycosyltransferase family 4 protein [Chloroflexota bacterium]|nr:glycosyltransferase family 4 protein [Chloroflexota bacterium]
MTEPGRPARVLHVISGCTVGGCEQHVLALLSRLDRRRYEPWLAYFEAEPDEAAPMAPLFRAAGVRTVNLLARRRTDPAAFVRLAGLIRRGGFDLVHTHSFRTELGTVLATRVMADRPRLVRTAHNLDDFYTRPRYRGLARAASRSADRLVAISDAVATFLRRDAGLPGERIERIYYGLDATPYRPDVPPPSRRAAGARPTLGVLARLAPQKGHRVLFDALPSVVAAVPNVLARIVGHEELSTVEELRAYAVGRGIADSVSFEGFRADVPELLADLDVFVLPSLWEGFGLVLLEAMAAGRPVVASAVGPIPEIVVNGETGLLVPPGDPDALARAVVRVLRDPDLAARLGRAGRARVEAEFGLDGMVARTEALYQDLLRTSARAATHVGATA